VTDRSFDWHDEQWWRAVKLTSLKEGEGFLFSAEGHDIALFRVGEEVFAVDDYCPHMGDSLSAGQIYQGAVICPRHMWAFRLTDGQCLDVASLRARTYQVAIRDGWVYVKKPADLEGSQSESKQ